jgi:Lon protease-like protein
MEPQLVEAGNPVEAMGRARFATDALVAPVVSGRRTGTAQWEGDWAGLTPEQTVRRRDRVLSRARWQFTERSEHQAAWRPGQGGGDVSEQG